MRLSSFARFAFALLLPPLARSAGTPPAPAVASLQDLDHIPFPRHVVAPICPPSLGPVTDRVEVTFMIDEQGNVGRVQAVSGENPVLRQAAVAAISQWRFDPPSRSGQPTQVAATQAFVFGPRPDSSRQTEMILPETPAAPTAAAATRPPEARSPFIAFLYSLLPKAFQKNPTIRMTVITETAGNSGERLAPTPERPTYYTAQTFAVADQGDADAVPPALLRGALAQALAQDHYLPAGPGRPPTQMLVFSWGIISEVSRFFDLKDQIDVLGHRFTRESYLARVKLVGGEGFASQVVAALNQRQINPVGPGPLQVLAERDSLARQLLEQAMADSYFVVASAYDAETAAKGQRRLLWKTKITVNSQDLAMADALAALIRHGGPYFGRPMDQTAILEVPLQAGDGAGVAR
jgi:TonB family protein